MHGVLPYVCMRRLLNVGYIVWEGRSDTCAVGRSGEQHRVGGQSRLLLHWFPALTPWLHVPMVDHGDGYIPGARVSPRVLPGISTYPACASSRLMHEGIGAVELDIGVGGGGVVGEGAGGGAGTGVGVGAGAGAGGTGV